MRAYKGFSHDLTARMGNGRYQYEVGKTYKTDEARCASTGFHCCEEPLEVLRWYSQQNDRYCIVEAGGDIHEDGTNRISCTEIEIVKEITLKELALLEAQFIISRPLWPMSGEVRKNHGEAGNHGIVVVRGKHPKAKGGNGARIVLLKEDPNTPEIIAAGAYDIDGKGYKPDVYYNVEGKAVRNVQKRAKKIKGA